MRRGKPICTRIADNGLWCAHARGSHAKDSRGFHEGACGRCACTAFANTKRPAKKVQR